MIRWLFQKESAADVVRRQLFEAERLAVEHRASAEHHAALAAMYEQRVERLKSQVTPSN